MENISQSIKINFLCNKKYGSSYEEPYIIHCNLPRNNKILDFNKCRTLSVFFLDHFNFRFTLN